MRIIILRSAIEDPVRGRKFYEKQGEGLGVYFEDSLASDIESLHIFVGIHSMVLGYHRMLSNKFPFLRFTMTHLLQLFDHFPGKC